MFLKEGKYYYFNFKIIKHMNNTVMLMAVCVSVRKRHRQTDITHLPKTDITHELLEDWGKETVFT